MGMRLTWPISSLREAKVSSGNECDRWFFAFTFSHVGKNRHRGFMAPGIATMGLWRSLLLILLSSQISVQATHQGKERKRQTIGSRQFDDKDMISVPRGDGYFVNEACCNLQKFKTFFKQSGRGPQPIWLMNRSNSKLPH